MRTPSLRHTIHQVIVGLVTTVIGGIIVLLLWYVIESRLPELEPKPEPQAQTEPVTTTWI